MLLEIHSKHWLLQVNSAKERKEEKEIQSNFGCLQLNAVIIIKVISYQHQETAYRSNVRKIAKLKWLK